MSLVRARDARATCDTRHMGAPCTKCHPSPTALQAASRARRQFTQLREKAILSCCGDVAQLGERRVRNAEVGSSILLVSTTMRRADVSVGPFICGLVLRAGE